MTDTEDWQEFERYALKIDELHHALEAAQELGNPGLARLLSERIKAAEASRDGLLCRIGHALTEIA